MNRKKKINQTLKNKAKKANAKLQTTNKPKYIAKADRDVSPTLCQTAVAVGELQHHPVE